MAKIICITTGLTGILNASFELLARLTAAGHQVVYASPKDVRSQVQSEGYAYIQLPAIDQHPGPQLPAFKGPFRKGLRLFYKIQNRKQRRKEALQNVSNNGLIRLLKDQQPDMLLIDIELHEYIIKAYGAGHPFILLSQWFSLWKRKGLPYLLHDITPGEGLAGNNLAIQLDWWKVKLKRWWTFTKQKTYSGFTDRRTILMDYARQEGFPLQKIRENYWPGPFTYSGFPVISLTAEEMEFPHDKPAFLYYAGAMVADKRVTTARKGNNGYSLDEVLEYRQKIGASLIYCSVSTLHKGDQRFIQKLIRAVNKRKDWVLVVSMGGLLDTKTFGRLPGNVFVFEYVDQLKILATTDCSINHGGIHTINECIHHKVPMLVYSGKRSDQNGCAARVAYHGLGLKGDKDKDGAPLIRSKINRVLTNLDFHKRVEQMHQHFLRYKKEQVAEKIINQFLARTM